MTNNFTLKKMVKYPFSLIGETCNKNHKNQLKSLNIDQFTANIKKSNQIFVNIVFSKLIQYN